jgi:photosystem II stability/assembly factor-like uncharacterized protein
LILLLANSVYAQDFWEVLPFPDSLEITCLAFNKQGDIFVGTNTNTANDGIFRSQDDGQTWELVLDMGLYGPASIAITNGGHIFSLGGSPGFYLSKSGDNGLTWESLPIPDYGGNVKIVSKGNDTLFVSQWAANGALLLKSVNGGFDWEIIFTTENHTSEYVADIALAPNGDICIGLGCFMPDMGGLYRSTNGGADWEFLGLFNRMVQNLEYNSQGDLIIGVRGGFDGSGGIYAIYHNNPNQIVECYAGPNVNGLTLNSAGHIYAGTAWPDGVTVSINNGLTFNYENSGLPNFPIGEMERDFDDYVYARLDGPSNLIYRSKYTTVTEVNQLLVYDSVDKLIIYSNPVHQVLRGIIDDDTFDGMYDYTITDMTGKQIACNQLFLSQNTLSLNVSFLSQGSYIFHLFCNGFRYSAKIIKG